MATGHTKIPKDIDSELSHKARKFFYEVIDSYESQIVRLQERILSLEADVSDLKDSFKLTPRNTSLPPSSVHPHAKPKTKKRPRSCNANPKKQGAQVGHKRNVRELTPTELCDHIIPVRPKRCRRCFKELHGSDPHPLRHQVIDIPEPKVIITEYQRHRLRCTCGASTCGALPEGAPTGQYGPRLAAFCGLLVGHYRQSRRLACRFLEDLLNVPCSSGWIIKIQNQVGKALEVPHQELRAALEEQPQLFVDESPTKQGKRNAWLWVAVAPLFTVFAIFGNRSRESLKNLLGDYSDMILNCDRAKMYLDASRLQWCWAHMKRDIQKLIDSSDHQVKRLGHDLMRQQRLMFEQWHYFKAEEITWRAFKMRAKPIRKEFDGLLLRGIYSGNRKLKGVCQELYNRRDFLWTFTETEGLEPTNNAAERALRPAVIQRKLSFGTQSEAGSRFLERILTVSETCRMQNRSTYQYLVETMEAHFHKRKPPSLIPTTMEKAKKVA
jgi:transposase